jgi:hypothetical protein
VEEYYRQMKGLMDSLCDLGEPVADRTLVLNLLRGLSPRYGHLKALIKRTVPFPTFHAVRSELLLEELTMTFEAPTKASTLYSTTPGAQASPGGGGGSLPTHRRPGPMLSPYCTSPGPSSAFHHQRRSSPRKGGRGGGNSSRGGFASRGGGPSCPSIYNPWTDTISMWSCQAPSASRPPTPALALLTTPPAYDMPPYSGPPPLPPMGPSTTTPWSSLAVGWDPAALASAYNTMALTPPPSDWAIDSGASYHTTPTTGTLSSSQPPSPTHPTSIVVRNSSTLRVTFIGASVLPRPFYLNDILVAPHITHNLLYVRRFTTDNSCSIEFDPTGFSVKDLVTRTPLAQCDSVGPLYTLRPSSTSVSPPPVLVSTTTSTTWHRCLGHPRPDVMTKLSSTLDSSCNRGHFEGHCHACQLGRHTRLPFTQSSSRVEQAFDLVHCDLWTSHVLSLSGYKYYLVILDDFSHFLWTFPLRLKSDTFTTLTHSFAWVST